MPLSLQHQKHRNNMNISYTNIHEQVVDGNAGASFKVLNNGDLIMMGEGESGYCVALPKSAFSYITGIWPYELVDPRDYEGFCKLVDIVRSDIAKIYAVSPWTVDRLYLGLWVDDDHVCVEISVKVDNLFEATLIGNMGDQMSIYDAKNGEVIWL